MIAAVPGRRRTAGAIRRLALVALVAGIGSSPLWANSAPSWPNEPVQSTGPASDAEQHQPAITFGRALDLEGTPLRLTAPLRRASSQGTRSGGTLARGSFIARYLPLRGAGITSGFGWRRHPISGGFKFHAGIDLAAPTGTPIVATAAGVVASADWYGGYGLCVTVDHQNGYVTLYGHMSQIAVSAGQQVQPGQPLGRVGSTGSSTGPHLHYELRRDGYAVNPGF
jgi:murein DD-endopeptidase MepM/ murein hydrolase activator NlpD